MSISKERNCLAKMNVSRFWFVEVRDGAASFLFLPVCVFFFRTACNDSFLSMARSPMVQTSYHPGPWIVLFGTPSTYAASWRVRRCCGGTSSCSRAMPWIQLPAWQLSVRWREETHQNTMGFLLFLRATRGCFFFENSFWISYIKMQVFF